MVWHVNLREPTAAVRCIAGTTAGDTKLTQMVMAVNKPRSGRTVIYCGEALGPDPQKKILQRFFAATLRPLPPLPLRRIYKGFCANYKQAQKRPEMRRLKS